MKWNSPQVNRKGVMKAYVDEYPNHAYGILKEDSLEENKRFNKEKSAESRNGKKGDYQ